MPRPDLSGAIRAREPAAAGSGPAHHSAALVPLRPGDRIAQQSQASNAFSEATYSPNDLHAYGLSAPEPRILKTLPMTLREFVQIARDPAWSDAQREAAAHAFYLRQTKSSEFRDGATEFLNYLHANGRILATALPTDLESWGLTKSESRGRIPIKKAFDGARAFARLAATYGYLRPETAARVRCCTRPLEEDTRIAAKLDDRSVSDAALSACVLEEYLIRAGGEGKKQGALRLGKFLEERGVPIHLASASDMAEWRRLPDEFTPGKPTTPNGQQLHGAIELLAFRKNLLSRAPMPTPAKRKRVEVPTAALKAAPPPTKFARAESTACAADDDEFRWEDLLNFPS